jgi:predicted metal-dependent phosphoesterase TrpH
MHVHSVHSGMSTLPILGRFCRESYSPPEAVYEALHRRGMGLVTLTDHDSIDGAERLRSRADFFVSEEVTCTAPSGTELHVGVYGITERHHSELQRRRNDLPRLSAYVCEQRLFASVNHPFSALTGARHQEDFEWFSVFPGIEVLNAHLARDNNLLATRFAEWSGQISLGGSDAHTVASVGSAWTEVPGARNRDEFLAGLRCGRGRVLGKAGTYVKMTCDVFRVAAAVIADSPWCAALAPLLVAVPVLTLGNFAAERVFAQKWARLVRDDAGRIAFDARRQPQEKFVA